MPTITQIKLPSGTVYDLAGADGGLKYKGTLGTGGDITTLPTASASNKEYVYRVITAGTYESQSAVVDDWFYSDGSAWRIIKTHDTQYPLATTSVDGLMSKTDKAKLNTIASGAEVNQNAFSNIKVGSTTVAADTTTDTVEFALGSGEAHLTITPDATNDKVTFATTGFGTAAGQDYTTSVTSGSNDLVTSGAVYTAIDNIPDPMVFKGTVGDSSVTVTWANLPAPSSASGSENVGWTYKATSARTTSQTSTLTQNVKAGDTIISDGTNWVVIPSGDEPSGTVTSVAAGVGLTTASGSAITSSGTVKAKLKSETASSRTAASKGSTANREYAVGVDSAGDLSVNIPWTDTTYTFAEGDTDGAFKVTSGGSDTLVPVHKAVINVEYDSTSGYLKKTQVDGNPSTSNIAKLSTTTVPNVTSVGSAPTLGTAIPADDITAWTTNTPTAVTFNVEGTQLQIGVTNGVAASLSYTAKSIPNVTSVGSAPTLGSAITVATGFTTT